MTSWSEFARQAVEIAEFGRARFDSKVAYLATVRADGGPRVHPVTPIIGDELYLFMEPTSPKGADLRRDPHYALHCAVEDMSGGGGEFYVRGHAAFTSELASRERAAQASPYPPKDHYILFVLSIEYAFMNQYIEGGSVIKRWPARS